MGLDRRTALRTHGVERGSAIVEGIAAVAVVFFLFVALVQSAILLLSHEAAEATVAAAARTASFGTELDTSAVRTSILDAVPGAAEAVVGVRYQGGLAIVWAEVLVLPPGPVVVPARFLVDAEVPVVVDP